MMFTSGLRPAVNGCAAATGGRHLAQFGAGFRNVTESSLVNRVTMSLNSLKSLLFIFLLMRFPRSKAPRQYCADIFSHVGIGFRKRCEGCAVGRIRRVESAGLLPRRRHPVAVAVHGGLAVSVDGYPPTCDGGRSARLARFCRGCGRPSTPPRARSRPQVHLVARPCPCAFGRPRNASSARCVSPCGPSCPADGEFCTCPGGEGIPASGARPDDSGCSCLFDTGQSRA